MSAFGDPTILAAAGVNQGDKFVEGGWYALIVSGNGVGPVRLQQTIDNGTTYVPVANSATGSTADIVADIATYVGLAPGRVRINGTINAGANVMLVRFSP